MFAERPRSARAWQQSTGSPRELTTLSEQEALRYTALVASVAGAVESGLSPSVSANRLVGHAEDPPALRFMSWRAERSAFAGRLCDLAGRHPCLVFADVRDCYGSIRPAVVGGALARLGAAPAACESVRRFLHELGERGVRGLPVGPDPSPVLANAVLTAVDRALERRGIPYLRWVDDVVAGAPDRRGAEFILADLAAAMRRIGLELNASKTRIVVDPSAKDLPVTASMTGSARRVG